MPIFHKPQSGAQIVGRGGGGLVRTAVYLGHSHSESGTLYFRERSVAFIPQFSLCVQPQQENIENLVRVGC